MLRNMGIARMTFPPRSQYHWKEKIMSTQIDVQPERAYSEQYAEVLEQLYDKMEGTANAAVAFAAPQKHDDLMVIPVASVGWRFGSGTGMSRQKEQREAQRGMGVGGTLSVSPVGFIEVKEGTARFRPIFTPDTLLKMQIVGGLIALGMIRGLSSLFKRRPVRKGEKRRGPLFNVVFSPRANIIGTGGRARKARSGFQPPLRLNSKKTRAGQAQLLRSKRK
jgi:uncharacterized spore protein YtfJ